MSVHPSICMKQLGSHWTDFHKIWYLSNFRKSVQIIHVSLKSNENKKALYIEAQNTFLSIFRSVRFRIFALLSGGEL
jgi:hypothetical protein